MKYYTTIFTLIFTIITFNNLYSQSVLVDKGKAKDLSYILLEDIFGYFKLNSDYKTDLQKKVFVESEKGKVYLDSIKILKRKILKKDYLIILPIELGKYNLNKKGFRLILERISSSGNHRYDQAYYNEEYVLHKQELNGFWFPSIPFGTFYNLFTKAGKDLFVKCNESTALNLENKKVQLKFHFKLNGKIETRKKFGLLSYFDVNYPVTKNIEMSIILDDRIYLTKKYK